MDETQIVLCAHAALIGEHGEELIRDPDTNPTAKCTAIRTLREIEAQQPDQNGAFAELDAYRATRRPRP